MLRARLRTTGVTEHAFTLDHPDFRGVEWKIYDVGGARHQRQAWAPYFDDGWCPSINFCESVVLIRITVDAIIFLAPISAFDQVLAEVSYAKLEIRSHSYSASSGPSNQSSTRLAGPLEGSHLKQASV